MRQKPLGRTLFSGLALASCLPIGATPVITSAPSSLTNNAGTIAVFSVRASGEGGLNYQWYWNGTNTLSDGAKVNGAQGPTLVISNVLGGDSGDFTVVVTDSGGTVTSGPPATLTVTLSTMADGTLFSDDFARLAEPVSPSPPWDVTLGNWVVTGRTLTAGTSQGYAYAYVAHDWTDYSVQGQIRFSSPNTWGGGIGGRLDPVTGAHYAAWVYPEGSPGGSNVLRLIRFQTWTNFGYRGASNAAMAEASGIEPEAEATKPASEDDFAGMKDAPPIDLSAIREEIRKLKGADSEEA